MAQDFFKLFGKDNLGEIGTDTTITTHNLTSVGIIATQALIEKQKKQIEYLGEIRSKNDELEIRLKKAKALIEKLEALKEEEN